MLYEKFIRENERAVRRARRFAFWRRARRNVGAWFRFATRRHQLQNVAEDTEYATEDSESTAEDAANVAEDSESDAENATEAIQNAENAIEVIDNEYNAVEAIENNVEDAENALENWRSVPKDLGKPVNE